ncbi:MAG: BBE domain-containing protein [Clostridia bacterium]|nr:BBE domain-containing protein [Clostridia bacterium]MBQ2242516.1 BBE domain-containing protein [Clostridia bacterium]MBQ5648921.1 BBE domain-containing protein [Clostridia bacterium]MBQ5808730.1 BBE domain-containing protein [Clostridia bacterium]MBR0327120.1 BBE domain-containing protein [Clostridia bacterium]
MLFFACKNKPRLREVRKRLDPRNF